MMGNLIERSQYGIDAPGLVRFFFIAGAVALAVLLVALFSSRFGQNLKITIVAISMLVGTAKRLTSGKAIGIDLWQHRFI